MKIKSIIAVAFAAVMTHASCYAQSAINTGLPATASDLTSLTMRQQFQAAASDINGLLSGHPATSLSQCPSNPPVFSDCLVVGVQPYIWYKWTGASAGWAPVGTINPTTGIFGSFPFSPTATTLGGVYSSTAPANEFANGVDTNGNILYTRPNFANISGIAATSQLPVGTSIIDPGTGVLESLLPPQTQTGPTYTGGANGTGWLQRITRRSNSGTPMSDTFPAATAPGMANGAIIDIHNVDGTATETITAGTGTQIGGGASATVGPARQARWVLDTTVTPPNWRPDDNTVNALLISNNLSDLANVATARTNLGLGTAATQNTGVSGGVLGFLNGNNTYSGSDTFSGSVAFNGALSGTGINNLFASPPAFGGTAANTGKFTSLTDTGLTSDGIVLSTGGLLSSIIPGSGVPAALQAAVSGTGGLALTGSPSLTTPTIAGATLSGTLAGSPSASGTWSFAGMMFPSAATGANQCMQLDPTGHVTFTGIACGSGGGGGSGGSLFIQDWCAATTSGCGSFTPGVTTSLTITNAPSTSVNLEVYFDGARQNALTWTLAGSAITFSTPIPGYVKVVEIQSGVTVATPGVNSIANTDGTLTVSPTTGSAIASLNLANANTWTSKQTFNGGLAWLGDTSATTSPGAGYVGELLTATASNVTMTSGTAANITSKLVTAGHWACFGQVDYNPTGTINFTLTGISTTSATLPSAGPPPGLAITATSAVQAAYTVGPVYYNFAASTTVYFVGSPNFTNTLTANGYLSCQRIW